MIGPLIKQVMDRLPPEKRKGYLLKPQANLTYESMLETILGKDGITPEMLKGQQERVQFIEKLMQVTSKDIRTELIKQNTKIIDEQFFALFSRIAQSVMSSGQEPMARVLIDIQTQLLEETEYGRQLKESVGELEDAQHELQEAGQGLTREKLLDFVLASKSDSRIRAYVSLARGFRAPEATELYRLQRQQSVADLQSETVDVDASPQPAQRWPGPQLGRRRSARVHHHQGPPQGSHGQ